MAKPKPRGSHLAVSFVIFAILAQAALSETRMLQTAAPIRIILESNAMDKKFVPGVEGYQKYIFSKQIITRVVKYYTLVLKVISPKQQQTRTKIAMDDGTEVPAGTFEADLFTVFYCYAKADTTFASAAPQDYDSTTGRPISGSFNLNLNQITPSIANALAHYGTFVHEFYHILVLNIELYQYFINAQGTKIGLDNVMQTYTDSRGKQRTKYVLAGSKSIQYVRDHLNDQTLNEILFEEGGGGGSAGSHWEYDFWPNDFMSATDTMPSLLSKLSLGMAEDSGWFQVDYNYAEPLVYAKNAGANFQDLATCPGARTPVPKGFCPASDQGKTFCGPDFRYKATCSLDNTFNQNGCTFLAGSMYCSVPSDDYADKSDPTVDLIGVSSRCVPGGKSGNVDTAFCGRITCNSDSTSADIKFQGGVSCTCDASQSTMSCGTLTIKCPDLSVVCPTLDTNKSGCPNDCLGRGFCLGTVAGSMRCFCTFGFKGTDCSEINTEELGQLSAGSLSVSAFSNLLRTSLSLFLLLFTSHSVFVTAL